MRSTSIAYSLGCAFLQGSVRDRASQHGCLKIEGEFLTIVSGIYTGTSLQSCRQFCCWNSSTRLRRMMPGHYRFIQYVCCGATILVSIYAVYHAVGQYRDKIRAPWEPGFDPSRTQIRITF